jgi:opacity protein-like surface antigen
MLKTTLKLATIASLIISTMASAAEYNFEKSYVSGSFGSSNMADESGTGFTIHAGVAYEYDMEFLKDLDTRVEISFLTTSESKSSVGSGITQVDFETSATAFTGWQRINFNVAPNIDLVTKVGFTRGSVSVTTKTGLVPVESEKSQFGLSYAFGGEYALSDNLVAGIGYAHYTAEINSLDASISYKF